MKCRTRERLLLAAGFEDVALEDCILRYEAGQPVLGFLVTARKQVQVAEKTGVRKRVRKSAQPASS